MAKKTPARLSCPTNFEKIEPVFNQEFGTNDPIFPEWTLERMPKKINIKRIKLDKNKMFERWLYGSYNTKGKFRCLKCIKSGIVDNDATWSSAYTTILCRAYYGPDTDEYGQDWIGGWIQMKIFAQQCTTCDEYVTAELDDQKCRNFVTWLHRWIAHKFYGYPLPSFGYRGKKSDGPHLVDRCEACHAGWCHFHGNKSQNKNFLIKQ
ncbi:unnamed protein product [Rotaria magnacalcarata]|uniref:3CxxC-type domain-containing protein n=1 Tax=Rotaria magnacalcarata TaxID=392030 RepID=A0A817AGQ1_9BILA|nr:unnamed protein product [Rotaria magnacalcarata]CAF2250797.1 unnamed protein product [Rotaria magnacalcarata]CAF3804571.1 unnamed protein product [Rotaria magnacalcarata]CAF4274916.1 unnamed protein product [Rotaria magnacalcarata]